ncbi:MFS transporter [Solwaraspora sp. WMMA2080]|uniref:CynX/NimT family MFS transporter n=1 Tax=unclassified Solwaraspora TaxID=2627926 RepID=UPI00248BE0EB|nr:MULTISPECIES: MFS transporter [unclassified Solwaraspora]WBB96648.1 MFS transporter [Solwaraspora sp. WMMA2059]WBC19448.1 MFS transporter [Solwaraspora sp. WMMA2080]
MPATAPAGTATTGAARRGTVVVLIAMILVALNLRLAITSLGPLLDEVRTGLALSGLLAGVVTMLPALAFASVGAFTPWLVRRFSPPQLLVASMAALATGQLLRVTISSAWLFVATSALALAGIAVANVLLPMLVRQYFPHRAGLVTGAYMMSLTIGASVSAGTAVPIAHAAGSWRAGLGFWALIAVAAAAFWVPVAWRDRRRPATGTPGTVGERPASGTVGERPLARPGATAVIRPGRTRLGWLMAGFFGAQSFGAYAQMGWLAQVFRDAGFRPETAGLLLAGVTAVAVPIALLMPTLATRMSSLRPLVLGTTVASALSYAGLLWLPYQGALVWMVLLALGQGTFPLALAMVGLRARTGAGVVSLSAFTQSTGYLIAALGPLSVGLLYEQTGGWLVPIALLGVALLVQTGTGWAIARPRWIEDEAGTASVSRPQPAVAPRPLRRRSGRSVGPRPGR